MHRGSCVCLRCLRGFDGERALWKGFVVLRANQSLEAEAANAVHSFPKTEREDYCFVTVFLVGTVRGLELVFSSY